MGLYINREVQNLIDVVECSASINIPAMLIGEAGTGKTEMLKYIANKNKKKFIRINMNGATSQEELIGKWLVNEKGTYFLEGPIPTCVRNGCWMLMDEINAVSPDTIFSIMSLLDDDRKLILAEKDGEIIPAHPDFRIFCSCNPSVDYAGTKSINKAFMSRFAVIKFPYYTLETTRKILESFNITKDATKLDNIAKIGADLQQAKVEGVIEYAPAIRDLLQFLAFSELLPIEKAFNISIENKVEADLHKYFELYFSKKEVK